MDDSVAPREGRVSRNFDPKSCLHSYLVAPREGRVSRNCMEPAPRAPGAVAPREGRVSRNFVIQRVLILSGCVAPREGRVSRNYGCYGDFCGSDGRAPRGACE